MRTSIIIRKTSALKIFRATLLSKFDNYLFNYTIWRGSSYFLAWEFQSDIVKLLNELNQPKWSDLGEMRCRYFVETFLIPLYIYSWLFYGFLAFSNSVCLLIFYSNFKMLIFKTNYFLFNPWYLCYILCSSLHGKKTAFRKTKKVVFMCLNE